MRRLLAFFCLVLLVHPAWTQNPEQPSCDLRISLLTCTPGEELYSVFGHTAIRVTDTQGDWVFNYGTFDFNEPDFYLKFVRGKLNYFLSIERFGDFLAAYTYEKRGITEQVLALSCAQKQALFQALVANAEGNQKFYKYDFLFDNCTTRAGVKIKTLDNRITTHPILSSKAPTFRNQLHEYLEKGRQPWSQLGIDLLLGSRIDRPVNNEEAQFLPEYLLQGIDSSFYAGQTLVLSKKTILEQTFQPQPVLFSPFLIFSVVVLLLSLFSYYPRNRGQVLRKRADQLLFSITGLLGLLLMFMWWGTDHASCRDNYNLLWALPLNLPLIWLRSNRFKRAYFAIYGGLQLIVLISWVWLPQELNLALIPWIAYLLHRSVRIAFTSAGL